MDSNDYCRYVRPYAGTQLRLLKLDYELVSGRGDWLVAEQDGKTFEVLDLLGGFGANLLGHNHPDIVSTAQEFLTRNSVQQAQLSLRKGAAQLGARISQLCEPLLGEDVVVHLSSTGSEAVEVALKNSLLKFEEKIVAWRSAWNGVEDQIKARLLKASEEVPAATDEWLKTQEAKAREFVIGKLSRSYHGRTLSAIAASDSALAKYLPKSAATADTLKMPADNPEQILRLGREMAVQMPFPSFRHGIVSVEWRNISRLAAIIVEPIQGEGGIFPLAHEVSTALNLLAEETGAILIADEIQCGLGRSGKFFASELVNLKPGVILFGKSLGGGIGKVAASAFSKSSYHKILGRFGSTFAEDEFSCRLALKSLDILTEKGVLERVQESGKELRQTIDALGAKQADVISEVRGSGLMLGDRIPFTRGQPIGNAEAFSRKWAHGLLDRELFASPPSHSRGPIPFACQHDPARAFHFLRFEVERTDIGGNSGSLSGVARRRFRLSDQPSA